MRQAGFTLIELMIAVAIVGILVTLAIPAYQDYTVRARVTEILYLAARDKAAVSEFFLTQNTLPQTAEQAGINTSIEQSNYLTDDVAVVNGVIVYTLGNLGHDAAVGTLLFTPTATVDGILWNCSSPVDNNGIPGRFLPAECRRS